MRVDKNLGNHLDVGLGALKRLIRNVLLRNSGEQAVFFQDFNTGEYFH